jgi:D-Tyr-tRNAtyr deacylase
VRLVVQRVTRGEVRVDGKSVGRIDRGLLVLVGAER